MASFTNFATLIYNGGTSNSNTVTGELLETLTLTKTAASSRYTAAEALKLFREHMGEARIVAIVISHAHVDHYGGIEGLISAGDAADPSLPLAEQIASGKTAIIVPQGFVDSVMRENVFAGTAMKRRATYQYGRFLP